MRIKQPSVRITCKHYTPHNNLEIEKLLVNVFHDTLSIWCRYCKKAHQISSSQCLPIWSTPSGLILPIGCAIVSPRNRRGVPKTIARVHFGGIAVWCWNCGKWRNVPKEQCLEAWEELK